MARKSNSPSLTSLREKKPPHLPSLDELIAEARELGEDDIANAFEKIRYLESPKGQRSLERRERRISRL
jgi:hypothetical protein